MIDSGIKVKKLGSQSTVYSVTKISVLSTNDRTFVDDYSKLIIYVYFDSTVPDISSITMTNKEDDSMFSISQCTKK